MGKKNERTLPGITMWTCIAIRLTHLIFQYSGEPDACSLNTQEQNNHILKNFDINGKFYRAKSVRSTLWVVQFDPSDRSFWPKALHQRPVIDSDSQEPPGYMIISEFRSVFCETSVTLYKKMITMIQDKIKPMVVSSMLDHDSLHGNTSGKSIEVSFTIFLLYRSLTGFRLSIGFTLEAAFP